MLNIGIYRSTRNKWIFGVCAGIANRFGVNPLWIRLGAVGLAVIPAGLGIPPMIAIYLLLTVLLPKQSDPFADL
jgi:phage shock protein C